MVFVMNFSKTNYSDRCLQVAGWSFVLAIFFAAFSTALVNIFSIAGLVFWFLSGQIVIHMKRMIRNPLCVALLSFILLLIASISWATPSVSSALDGIKTYRKLLFFFAVFAICWFLPQWKDRLSNALFFSIFITALASVCVAIGVPGFPKPDPGQGAIFMKNHITQGFLMGILVLLGVRYILFSSSKVWKIVGALAVVLAVYVTFYLTNGRTGFLSVGLALGSLVLFLPRTLKQKVVVFSAVAVLMAGVLATSDRFQNRFDQATSEIEQYSTQVDVKQKTSMGLRMLFWERGLNIIESAPFLGYGVGSWSYQFDQDQLKDGIDKNSAKYQVCGNPHNDYIMMASQVGVLGLMLWLLFLGMIYRFSKIMSFNDSFLIQGVLLIYCCGCLFNSFTYDVTEGTVFLILSAGFLGAAFRHIEFFRKVEV